MRRSAVLAEPRETSPAARFSDSGKANMALTADTGGGHSSAAVAGKYPQDASTRLNTAHSASLLPRQLFMTVPYGTRAISSDVQLGSTIPSLDDR